MMGRHRWRETIRFLRANYLVVEKHWELLWNLGWCYFKLERMDDAGKYLRKANFLAPKSNVCKFGLGQVYLKKKQYKKAESILSEGYEIKATHKIRISLALAYLAQGKIEEAEKMHLENIKAKPTASARYESYAAFLYDVGREAEAKKMTQKAKRLQQIQ